MLSAGHGFISLTGATAALRGGAEFAPLAVAKASLRMLDQSLAREFHPKGIHVVT
jgi:NAD(P)-dependent dehydrogenase (short-subunit alcohol dehydrogenase family)